MELNELERYLISEEELTNHYPIVNLGGKLVRYDPEVHELEEGEPAVYFDFEEQKIKEGTIEKVEHSDPMKYPVYTIAGKSHIYKRVWPKVEDNEANLSAKEERSHPMDDANFMMDGHY